MHGGRRLALTGVAAFAAAPHAHAQWLWWLRAPRDWDEVGRELAARYPDVAPIDGAALQAMLVASPSTSPSTSAAFAAAMAALATATARTAPRLLDVRTPAEWTVSRIPGARPAFDDAAVDAALAGADAATPVVAYCAIGLRSARLARRLAEAGRPGVRNLDRGIFGWADAGRPLVDDRGAARVVHPYDAGWGRLLSDARRAPL